MWAGLVCSLCGEEGGWGREVRGAEFTVDRGDHLFLSSFKPEKINCINQVLRDRKAK